MEAKELRIGNLISFKGYKLHVTHIPEDDRYFSEKEPIPLTEEWLIRFGFHYEEPLIYGKSGWYLKLKNQDLPCYIFVNNKLQISLFISSNYSNSFIDTQIKHVHQLQNLYFALTGEELELIN